jgi:8-oxo-dGTP diphosphatase/2-hydroxy-dATP diphosphatase
MPKQMTLCIIYDNSNILLGMKKRGFGEGRWNGFGGKVQEGESIQDAALRELNEEISITPIDLKNRGKILFEFQETGKQLEVHLFSAKEYSGEPIESEEMLPKVFNIKDIPYDEMWDDDKYWLPILLEGHNIDGYFLFDSNDKVIKKEIKTF